MYSAELMGYADFEWATKLNRLTLNIVGLWPNIRGNISDRFLSNLRAIFTLLLIVFIGIIPAMLSLVKTWGDMLATIDNLQFSLPLVIGLMKLVIIWRKKSDLILVLNMIADDWLKAKTDEELHVMIKHTQNARVIIIFGYIFMTVGISLLVFPPFFGTSLRYMTNITNPVKILPLHGDYFYNENHSPYYELTFAAQALLIVMASASYTGIDNLLGLLVFHLCSQMENLKERFINVRQFKNFNNGLAFIVKDHIRLIKYFNIVENMFSLLLLGLLLYFGISFCLYGFLIVTVLTEGQEMSIMRFIYLISAVSVIFGYTCLYCAVGEILVAECEGMYHAAYDYEWYMLEPEEARSLIILMIRAEKSFRITVGKMFPMTLSTFCNLMKTSGGYISVLFARQRS